LLQRLVLSLSVIGRTLVESGLQSALNWCTVRPITESGSAGCCSSTVRPPEDERGTARSMSGIIMWHVYCYRMEELCVGLVIETSLFFWIYVKLLENIYCFYYCLWSR